MPPIKIQIINTLLQRTKKSAERTTFFDIHPADFSFFYYRSTFFIISAYIERTLRTLISSLSIGLSIRIALLKGT